MSIRRNLALAAGAAVFAASAVAIAAPRAAADPDPCGRWSDVGATTSDGQCIIAQSTVTTGPDGTAAIPAAGHWQATTSDGTVTATSGAAGGTVTGPADTTLDLTLSAPSDCTAADRCECLTLDARPRTPQPEPQPEPQPAPSTAAPSTAGQAPSGEPTPAPAPAEAGQTATPEPATPAEPTAGQAPQPEPAPDTAAPAGLPRTGDDTPDSPALLAAAGTAATALLAAGIWYADRRQRRH